MTKPQKLLIQLPEDERGLGQFHIARFDKLKRRLERKDLRPKDRAATEDELAALIAAPKDNAERASLEQSLAQTIALAKLKGEEVGQQNGRVFKRGGLRQAYEDGHLDPLHGPLRADALYEVGRRYRDHYEVSEGLTTARGGGGGFGPKGPQPRMLEAAYFLARMRDALSERQIEVLDRVCGQDKRLRLAATELKRGVPGCRNSLRGGLAILAELKIEAPKIKTDGGNLSVKEYTESKTKAIADALRVA